MDARAATRESVRRNRMAPATGDGRLRLIVRAGVKGLEAGCPSCGKHDATMAPHGVRASVASIVANFVRACIERRLDGLRCECGAVYRFDAFERGRLLFRMEGA